jgi:hypothetical protein
VATVVPVADSSYLTFAWVGELRATESTLGVTAAARGLDAKALTAEANSEPFCNSWTRLLSGVEEPKNEFQLVMTCETAPAEPPLALGGTAGADTAVGCTSEGAAENDPCAY